MIAINYLGLRVSNFFQCDDAVNKSLQSDWHDSSQHKDKCLSEKYFFSAFK